MKFLLLLAFLFTFGQNLPQAEVKPVPIEVTVWPSGGTLEVKLLDGLKWPSEVKGFKDQCGTPWVREIFGSKTEKLVIVTNAKANVLVVTNLGSGKIDLSETQKSVVLNLPRVFPQGVKVARRQSCRWGKSGVLEPICR